MSNVYECKGSELDLNINQLLIGIFFSFQIKGRFNPRLQGDENVSQFLLIKLMSGLRLRVLKCIL